MPNPRKYIFFYRLNKIYKRLSPPIKRKIGWIALFTIVNSFLEILGLAMFLPVIGILLEDDYISKVAFFNHIYQTFSFSSENQFTVILMLLIAGIFITKNVVYLYINNLMAKQTFSIQTYLSNEVFKSYLISGLKNIKKRNSNIVVWKTNTVPAHFVNFLIVPLIQFVNELIILILIFTGLLLYNPKVMLFLMVVVLPLTYLFYSIVKNKIRQKREELSEVQPQINKIVQQGIFGYTDVLLSQTQNYFISLYEKWLKKSQQLQASLYTYMLIPAKLIETIIILLAVTLVIYGVLIIQDKKATLSLIGVFSIAAYRIIPSINKITVSVLTSKSHEYTMRHIIEAFNLRDKAVENNKNKKLRIKEFKNKISISNLSFKYTLLGKNVLQNIQIEIFKGQNIGIIGKSGSGKSTLINLLLGFYENYKGEITVDGLPLNQIYLNDWYRLIGYVQQNIFLIDGTIEENIAFGVPPEKINQKRLKEVIQKASLNDFIKQLPKGIKTRVGELGNFISGGQKQRIGIARALYAGAQILLFDEATSALDNETEIQITESLGLLSKQDKEITIITIAHRYTTLKYCDVIYELDEGKIKQQLQYSDLLKKIN